tara:strand:+ start:71 stop:268 length:198 start_codon:yes stop_codon:yes gene_type:complete
MYNYQFYLKRKYITTIVGGKIRHKECVEMITQRKLPDLFYLGLLLAIESIVISGAFAEALLILGV